MKLPETYRRARIFFGALFLISVVVYCLLSSMAWGEVPPGMEDDIPPEMENEASLGEIATMVTAFASCITALIAFFGFAFTTTVGWRKDRREAEKAMLEKEKLELEIERKRRELNIDE